MISLEDIRFAYPHQAPIFEGFSWRVEQGEVWSILGPSGCGKSTLLLLLAGLQHPQQGTISAQGEPLTRPRPNTALVLQDYGLLPWATLRDNVTLGLRIRRLYGPDGRHAPRTRPLDTATVERRGTQWLQRLDIEDVADQRPSQVSGGQRQRAAIARALVLEPDLLLMDEPFAALDAPTRESLQTLTLDLAAEARLTVILVTHSIEEAAFIGQNVLLLRHPPNRIPGAIANPHPTAAFRRSAAYHTMCGRLRQELDKALHPSPIAEGMH
jgi:ABC-type nitrate/sulfonate/bicarbonate transport system ATPase subunit